jgi:hypothetical protein
MTTTQTTATELRTEAARHYQDAADSFERCDTDGFLSQWASGQTARLRLLEADLVEAGGVSKFIALFTTEGQWVPAKVIDGKYGKSWMLLDAEGKRTGEYVPFLPKRRETLAKRGYCEGYVMRPARAEIVGTTYFNCRASAIPTDSDWDAPVSIVTPDRFAD